MKAIYIYIVITLLFFAPINLPALNNITLNSKSVGKISIGISNTENIKCFQFNIRATGGTIKNIQKKNRLLRYGWTVASNIKNDTVAYIVVFNSYGDSLEPGSDECITFDCALNEKHEKMNISIENIKGIDSNGNLVDLTAGDPISLFENTIAPNLSGQNQSNIASIGNFPNPFNPTTTITFSLLENAFVAVNIYDVSGRLIMVLNYGELFEGTHLFQWNGKSADGRAVSSGIYFAQIKTHFETVIHKMLLTK
jgi:hypothetical protein